jgi:heterodisulfide reductase subunit A-like polyferredoxin
MMGSLKLKNLIAKYTAVLSKRKYYEEIRKKVSVVTGGNSGIGLATAILFAKMGLRWLLLAATKPLLTKLLRQSVMTPSGLLAMCQTIRPWMPNTKKSAIALESLMCLL